jgi:FkbM family methyltransferase
MNSLEKDRALIGHRQTLTTLAARGWLPRAIVDVGASDGKWTRLALSVFPNCDYLLVEPLTEHEEALSQLSKEYGRVRIVQCAAGREDGLRSLAVATDLDGSSLVWTHGGTLREIPVIPLSTLIAQAGLTAVSLIKVDVQGFELEVLGGLERWEALELLILEASVFRFSPHSPLIEELIDELRPRGFRLIEVVDVIRRPLDNAMAQCDLLFCREDHWLLADTSWG